MGGACLASVCPLTTPPGKGQADFVLLKLAAEAPCKPQTEKAETAHARAIVTENDNRPHVIPLFSRSTSFRLKYVKVRS